MEVGQMACKEDITADMARQLLNYDPDTGEFRWRERVSSMFVGEGKAQESLCRKWNARYANTLTGNAISYPGYLRIGVLGKIYLAHRVAWLMSYGYWPKEDIDHVDGRRDKNHLSNLREASRAENLQNISMHSTREGGLVGANFHKRTKR
jgi:nuclear transport factor 2 (NTF2) superfamily protein